MSPLGVEWVRVILIIEISFWRNIWLLTSVTMFPLEFGIFPLKSIKRLSRLCGLSDSFYISTSSWPGGWTDTVWVPGWTLEVGRRGETPAFSSGHWDPFPGFAWGPLVTAVDPTVIRQKTAHQRREAGGWGA